MSASQRCLLTFSDAAQTRVILTPDNCRRQVAGGEPQDINVCVLVLETTVVLTSIDWILLGRRSSSGSLLFCKCKYNLVFLSILVICTAFTYLLFYSLLYDGALLHGIKTLNAMFFPLTIKCFWMMIMHRLISGLTSHTCSSVVTNDTVKEVTATVQHACIVCFVGQPGKYINRSTRVCL